MIQYSKYSYEFKRSVLFLRTVYKFDGDCYCYRYFLTKSDFKSKGTHLMKKSNVIEFIWVRRLGKTVRIVNISFIILSAYVMKLYIFLLLKDVKKDNVFVRVFIWLSFCKKKKVVTIVNIFLSLYCLHMSLNLTILY